LALDCCVRLVFMTKCVFIVLLMLSLAGCSSANHPAAAARSSAPTVPQKPIVLDVRTPAEYQAGHIEGVINVPLNQLEGRISELAPAKDIPLEVHCQSGGRSAKAKQLLEKLGYTNVVDLGSLAHAREVLGSK
jgi:phage shock protein E